MRWNFAPERGKRPRCRRVRMRETPTCYLPALLIVSSNTTGGNVGHIAYRISNSLVLVLVLVHGPGFVLLVLFVLLMLLGPVSEPSTALPDGSSAGEESGPLQNIHICVGPPSKSALSSSASNTHLHPQSFLSLPGYLFGDASNNGSRACQAVGTAGVQHSSPGPSLRPSVVLGD